MSDGADRRTPALKGGEYVRQDRPFIKVSKPFVGNEEFEYIQNVLLAGIFNEGPYVKVFERWMNYYLDKNHEDLDTEQENFPSNIGQISKSEEHRTVATNSGTSALHLALLSLGVNIGDRVITTPLSFFATVEAIMHCGAEPVFSDVNKWGVLDPDIIMEKMEDDENWRKVKAIIPVHMLGVPCEMDKFRAISETYNIPIVEDAAQAHGGEYQNQMLGTFGDFGCFSFFATKTITTVEGGMIYCKDPTAVINLRMMRNHGLKDSKNHVLLGYNYRLNELQAAMGCAQMMKYKQLINDKISMTYGMLNRIRKIGGVEIWGDLINNSKYRPAWWWCPVLLPTKEIAKEFRDFMFKRGIGTRYRYDEPLYKQPVIAKQYAALNLSMAEVLAGRIVGLPNHPGLQEEDLETIYTAMEEWAALEGN